MSTQMSEGLGGRKAGSGLLPTFLVIGAMKAGTTSLWRYLRNHPQVFMPPKKELDYFATGMDRGLGRDWYEAWFEAAYGASQVGEASPTYSAFPTYPLVAPRIAALLPDVRLIYLIRHPIDRMRSQWVHWVAKGRESRSIEHALVEDTRYLDYSRYALQLSQYLGLFDRDQILLLPSEELRDARKASLGKVFEFLGVDREWWSPQLGATFHESFSKAPANALARAIRPVQQNNAYRAVARKAPRFVKNLNRRLMRQHVDPRGTLIRTVLRRHLEGLLRDDVRDLRALMGKDFDGWGLI